MWVFKHMRNERRKTANVQHITTENDYNCFPGSFVARLIVNWKAGPV